MNNYNNFVVVVAAVVYENYFNQKVFIQNKILRNQEVDDIPGNWKTNV